MLNTLLLAFTLQNITQDLLLTLLPPLSGLNGPCLSVPGVKPPMRIDRMSNGQLFSGRIYTACRPHFVDLSNCGIAENPDTRNLLENTVLRGLYSWDLGHAAAPDSLVLVRRDAAPRIDAAIRTGTAPPKRLTSPYSPHSKRRARRGKQERP